MEGDDDDFNDGDVMFGRCHPADALAPAGNRSTLASLFADDSGDHMNEASQVPLTYQAPIQPKAASQMVPKVQDNSGDSKSHQRSSMSPICALSVTVYRHKSSGAHNEGKAGLVLLGDHKVHSYQVVTYRTKQDILYRMAVSPSSHISVHDARWLQVVDETSTVWSMLIEDSEQLEKFCKHFLVAKYFCSGCNQDGVIMDLGQKENADTVSAHSMVEVQYTVWGIDGCQLNETAACDSTAKFKMGKGESPWHLESALVGAVKGIPRIIIIQSSNDVTTKNFDQNKEDGISSVCIRVTVTRVKAKNSSKIQSEPGTGLLNIPDVALPDRGNCEGGRDNAESVSVSEASEKTSKEKAQLLARVAKMGGQPVVPMIPPSSGFVCNSRQEASVTQEQPQSLNGNEEHVAGDQPEYISEPWIQLEDVRSSSVSYGPEDNQFPSPSYNYWPDHLVLAHLVSPQTLSGPVNPIFSQFVSDMQKSNRCIQSSIDQLVGKVDVMSHQMNVLQRVVGHLCIQAHPEYPPLLRPTTTMGPRPPLLTPRPSLPSRARLHGHPDGFQRQSFPSMTEQSPDTTTSASAFLDNIQLLEENVRLKSLLQTIARPSDSSYKDHMQDIIQEFQKEISDLKKKSKLLEEDREKLANAHKDIVEQLKDAAIEKQKLLKAKEDMEQKLQMTECSKQEQELAEKKQDQNSSEEMMKMLSALYKVLKTKFPDDETFMGKAVKDSIIQGIRDFTVKLIGGSD
ncbi:unnamed protein product [Darwinula stevensoni]|uniref:Uncharacterized protein n=1 Tax=Darwinula stevensoni TaxID=69355 RepID=A0A7R8X4F2_9CRUS|nr:unnamed protein product [Darwinula stevensoni]CAG0879615.1 unnamed protein product [Darwinula stevensoni]